MHERTLIILKAIVVEGQGPDNISLTIQMPSSFTYRPEDPLYLDFKATRGTGAAYVRENFEIEPEIVKC